MEWLMLVLSLEGGMTQEQLNRYEMPWISYVTVQPSIVICDVVWITGEIVSYQEPKSWRVWYPSRVDYSLQVELRLEMVSFGVRHDCYHHVDSAVDTQPIRGGAEKVFIRVQSRLH